MKALYSSALIPPEWISAHGWRPCRVQALPAEEAPPAGVCPFAWTWLQTALREPDGGCIILTAECDMMRRLAELAATRSELPVFSFQVPVVPGNGLAESIFRSELGRLGRFLVRHGGHAWFEPILAHNIAFHAKTRRALLESRTEVTPRCFAESIANFQHHLTNTPQCPIHPPHPGDIPLALVGSPLMEPHFELHDLIERAGGVVALDATETGELSLPATVAKPDAESRDLISILFQTYYQGVPSIHRRPNAEFYQWLGERLTERAIRGIVHVHYPWCDPWHGEAQRMKEWSPVPLLSAALSPDAPLNGHLATRIEAFLEALR